MVLFKFFHGIIPLHKVFFTDEWWFSKIKDRPNEMTNGDFYFDDYTNKFYIYNGSFHTEINQTLTQQRS